MITDSTGALEREIVSQIINTGNCVRIAAKHVLEAEKFAEECPVVHLDFNNPDTYGKALENVDSIFLGLPMNQPQQHEIILPFIEIAKQRGVKHIVGMGTVGESDDSPLMIAERCMQNCGLNYTIIRPNISMQSLKDMIGEGVRRDSAIYLPGNGAKISLVDSRDIAEAVAKILLNGKHSDKIYVFTGAAALSASEIASILSEVTEREIVYKPVSHNQEWQMLLDRGWDEVNIELSIGLYEIARHGWCEKVTPDLRDVLGREPVSFKKFARDFKNDWF
ncbi:NmrA family transcriptional regulator [Chitinispirillum alkaliphilum]|nr:NmrA family transcriptional regulator [Chitinispirillum alkaliphilum]